MPDPLSPMQARLYAYFVAFLMEHGYQPSLADMSEEFKVSPTCVSVHLSRIAGKGWTRITTQSARAVQILYWPDGSRFVGMQPRPDDEERFELVKTSWGAVPVGDVPC